MLLKKTLLVVVLWRVAGILSAQEGSVDMTFNPLDAGYGSGDGPNSTVHTMALQPDGKLVIGGSFTYHGHWKRQFVQRMDGAGVIDLTYGGFNHVSGPSATVRCIAIQPDGKILLGGEFFTVNGYNSPRLARVNAAGATSSF